MRKLAVVLVLLVSVACSSGDDDGGPGGTSTPSEATAAEVRDETFTITDAQVGELTFDALVAGDPDAAADGRLVLLLHGFPESAESYREMLPPLADAGYYAVAPSQRGYSPGARPPAVEDYNILRLVEDAVAIADVAGADTFHIVGHDWGGAVAWVTAAVHPEEVTSLTALSTPHPDAISNAMSDPAGEQSQLSGYMETFRAPGSEQVFLEDGADTFVTAFSSAGLPTDKAEVYAELLATPEALGAALNWYRANPLPTDLRIGPTKVPTLYVWGTEDLAFARSTAEATAALVEAPYTFKELQGRGHWLPEEAPDDLTPLLLDHLGGR
ncbi:MAG TPA: alpha/beta hydrolase [Acidimicrobiales bacterium]